MWAHLSGVCFTSSGDHSEDKGGGEEGGGGGEVFDLDRDTQRQRTHKNILFYIYHARWTPFLFFIFFTLRVKLPPGGERSAEVKAAQRLFVFIRLT